MPETPNKSEVARMLADAHRRVEPAISRIIRMVGEREQDESDPVKLLEVNADTSPSGVVPIAFGPDPPRIPFSLVVIEVTEAEFERIRNGDLPLPSGWRLDAELYPVGLQG